MHLDLPESLTVHVAAELKRLLLGALDRSPELELDARGATEVDVAGVQVIAAAAQSAMRRGGRIEFVRGGRSEALVRALERAALGGAGAECFVEVDRG